MTKSRNGLSAVAGIIATSLVLFGLSAAPASAAEPKAPTPPVVTPGHRVPSATEVPGTGAVKVIPVAGPDDLPDGEAYTLESGSKVAVAPRDTTTTSEPGTIGIAPMFSVSVGWALYIYRSCTTGQPIGQPSVLAYRMIATKACSVYS